MDSRDLQRDAQLSATAEGAFDAQIEGRLKNLHTSMPGIIASFDPDSQTASIQPTIKRIFTERGAVNLPLCVDVPVSFPGGGDFFLTFPVKTGDECILLFSERAIDMWHFGGNTQPPAEYRLHDLSDGMAIVGINSQPRKIPAFNNSDTEFRSRDGETKVQIKPDGTIKNINPNGNTELTADGKFIINAPAGFEVNTNTTAAINSPQIAMNGSWTNSAGAAGAGAKAVINLPVEIRQTLLVEDDVTTQAEITNKGKTIGSTHKHKDVVPGGGISGVVD